ERESPSANRFADLDPLGEEVSDEFDRVHAGELDRASRQVPCRVSGGLPAGVASSRLMGGDGFEKQDRLARLMRELQLFQAARRGLTSAELAEKMGISQRQAQRDIAVLETEEGVPFVK